MPHELDCLICAGPCEALGVFHCGHFTCFTCALRIHHFGNKACPVCRKTSDTLYITRRTPAEDDGFDVELELLDFLLKENEKLPAAAKQTQQQRKGKQVPHTQTASAPEAPESSTAGAAPAAIDPPSSIIRDNFLKCLIEDQTLAHHVAKLYEQLCPFVGCWNHGAQEPFLQPTMLREHLNYDHKVRHCQICLQFRPAFLAEQIVYNDKEFDQHNGGTCRKDVASFQGHPMCRFCSGRRFYDVEQLIKHLQHDHFTCDLCNRGTFTFTFYQNRSKLIEHYQRCHKLCEHPDCAQKDPMLRVFHSELDLQAHRQREHGAGSAGLSLEALGMFNAPAGSNPATSANSTASRITFDYVSRVESIDTTPKTGNKGAQQDDEHHYVIPRHYVNPNDHITALQSTGKPMGTPLHSSVSSRDTPLAKKPVQAGGWKNSESELNNNTDKRNNRSAASAKLAAANEKFEGLLQRYLANPKVFVDFRHAAADYLSGKMLATEFYQLLTNSFFPKAEHLNEVFPLLIETMPIAQKAEALNQIRRMRNAPEMQRLQRAKEEDEKKAAAAALLAAGSAKNQGGKRQGADSSSVVNQLLLKKQNNAGAWSAAVASAPPPQPAPAPVSVSPTSRDGLWNTLPPSRGTGGTGSPTAHADPENFPSLPGAGGNRRALPPRGNAPKPAQNVWAQKAAKK